MSKLDEAVQRVWDNLEEEYRVADSLKQTRKSLLKQQEEKIREVALKLLPVMQVIKARNYFFYGKNTDYRSARGPVLHYDNGEYMLYVFSVEEQGPCVVNLYDNSVKKLSYRKLVEDVKFLEIMQGLLLVLEHYKHIQEQYRSSINGLESELKTYEDI